MTESIREQGCVEYLLGNSFCILLPFKNLVEKNVKKMPKWSQIGSTKNLHLGKSYQVCVKLSFIVLEEIFLNKNFFLSKILNLKVKQFDMVSQKRRV